MLLNDMDATIFLIIRLCSQRLQVGRLAWQCASEVADRQLLVITEKKYIIAF